MFKKLACDFSIRTRLKTFLLLPWCIILFLGINHASDYLDAIKQARQANLSIAISSQVTKLIYELQKERGLSSGVIDKANSTKLVELQKQREKTDLDIKHYIDFIQRIELTYLQLKSIANQDMIKIELQKSLTRASELAHERKKVDAYKSNSYFFLLLWVY